MDLHHYKNNCFLKKSISIIFLSIIVFSSFAQNIYKGEIIDNITGEKLAFASISKVGANLGTISNADGYFSFRTKSCPIKVSVSYIGYQTKNISLDCNSSNEDLQIFLEPSAFSLQNVNIYDNDFISKFVLKSRRKNKRYLGKTKTGKSFFRFYSFIDNQPVEYYEGFYNIVTSINGIHSIDFKSGQHRFASVQGKGDKYFATTILSPILQLFSLYGKSNQVFRFPSLPYFFASKRKLNKAFHFSLLSSEINENKMSIVEFDSKKDSCFSGELVLDSLLNIVKVSCNKTFLPHEAKPIIPHSQDILVDSMHMKYVLFFDNIDETIILNHSIIELQYSMENQFGDTIKISTTILNSNFDYDKQFTLPVFPKEYKGKLHDIMLCSLSPFFDNIYENENVIEPTRNELLLDKHFDRVSKLSNNYWFHLIDYVPWKMGFSIDPKRLKKTLVIANSKFKLSTDDDHIFGNVSIKNFFYSDYICYNNKPKFSSNVIFDYEKSYCSIRISDSLLIGHLNNYFHLAKVYSLKSEIELNKKFKNTCPSKAEILKIETDIYSKYEEEKKNYSFLMSKYANNPLGNHPYLQNTNYYKEVLELLQKRTLTIVR